MTGSSILPVTIHNGQLLFLFGYDMGSTPGWSCWGGGCDDNENLVTAAAREGAEESMGFLGTPKDILKILKRGHIKLSFDSYHMHIINIPYDKNMPDLFTRCHNYLWDNLNKNYLKSSKIFEKTKMEWFTVNQMKSKRSKFRNFYRKIVDQILENHLFEISRFAKRPNKTRKNR